MTTPTVADLLRQEVLVVDDTPTNRYLLSNILMRSGYGVRMVSDGAQALETVRENQPDLILLDIKMPFMDGYAVCEALKADEATADIPIIFISALDDISDKMRAFAAGGVDYLTKPFHKAEVLARVSTHLELRRLQQNLRKRLADLDAFAHTVAHDLKNPLVNLVGFAEQLKEYHAHMEPGEVDVILKTIVRSGRKLSSIVDELLLLATLRQEDLVPDPLNMGDIVNRARHRLQPLVEKTDAQISMPAHWPTAFGYAPWVEEVWANYLSNGLKYGGKPPVLELGFTLEDSYMVRFWIRDNGPGLADEIREQLFTKLMPVRQAYVSSHGLGLTIVKRIVNKLGGHVGVDNLETGGCCFFFTLPLAHE